MRFVVRHIPAGGHEVLQETLDAQNESELRTRLLRNGGVVLHLRRANRPLAFQTAARFDVAWWCRELETLLRAGMTAVEAIETLAAGSMDQERSRVHAALLTALREGASLSRAMRAANAFPEVLVAGVTASERTSTLADALRDYLRYDDLLQRLRRQAVSAALYPAMVIGLGSVISIFLLLYVIPRFSRMYDGLHGALSPTTKAVLWLSSVLRDQWALCVVLLAGLAVAGIWTWRSGQLLLLGERLLEAVTPLRMQWDHFRMAKLYQSLAMLFRGGYTFDEALQVCGGIRLGARMEGSIALARDAIARGKSASSAMASSGLTDVTTQRLLAVGERTGSFDAILQTVADRHAQVFATFIERATRVVEPVLLLVVALVVGGLVVMMYMPIFDIAGGLGVSR